VGPDTRGPSPNRVRIGDFPGPKDSTLVAMFVHRKGKEKGRGKGESCYQRMHPRERNRGHPAVEKRNQQKKTGGKLNTSRERRCPLMGVV